MSDGPDGGRSALSAEQTRDDARGSDGRTPSLTLSGRVEHIEDEFDALADLFLTDAPAGGARARGIGDGTGSAAGRAALDRPAVEGLIVGHLPVSASSWVKTYAAMRARALGGPVGLIRVLGGTMMIDLVGVDSRGSSEEPEALDSALDRLRSRAVGIVVRVDEINEPELVGGAIDGLVVLSGADEAAIVGAFRTIKSLVGEDARGIEAPAIRAAIFGVGRAEAQEAFERLARSVRHSLSCEIALAGSVERIVAEPSATLYHGAWEGSLGVLLDRLSMGEDRADERGAFSGERILVAGESRADADESRSDASVAATGRTGDRVDAHPVSRSEVPRVERVGEGVAQSARPGGASAVEAGVEGEVKADDRAAGAGEIGKDAGSARATLDGLAVEPSIPDLGDVRGGLASLVDGLASCGIRCPDDPGIELAIDREGGLVVVSEDLARGEGVVAWARKHAGLIAMADARVRHVREGVTLVVRDAPRARNLLDTGHRIVLLVEMGGMRGCAALN